MMRKAYIVAMMRSPIGKEITLSPQELSLQVLARLFRNSKTSPADVDFFALGSVISLKTPDQAAHKEISLKAGMHHADSESVEKACSSGLLAVYRAAESVWHEGADIAVAGGVDIMSKDPEASKKALTCPMTKKMMYQLADEKALELGISKEKHDRYSSESYALAVKNLFNCEPFVTAIEIPSATGTKHIIHDELVTAFEGFADYAKASKKNPLKPDCKIISIASSSKPADGAAFLAFASYKAVKRLGLKPLAVFSGYSRVSGPEPRNFIIEPVNAVQKLLQKTKKVFDEIDYFLINEAFATSPLWFSSATGVARERINPRGGAIACGHPLGMSGAKLVIEAVHILQSENKKQIAVSVCNAPDEATAGLIERI